MKTLDAYWYSQNPLAWMLLPVSWFYCSLSLLRRFLYRTGILKSYKIPVPLVIIGNISVGGTGKTPLLIALCELLKKQGIRPGIVSRGYGGNFTGERLVDDSDTPFSIGDEPFLIAQRTQCPVSVGKNRVAAAELLLKHHSCDVLLSDDGLQHYRMRRDIEIAVIDVDRHFGNGYCLPSGPLREPVGRLKQVDLIVHHGLTTHNNSFVLEFSDAVNLVTGETRSVASFSNAAVHAVAGIGHPERFFEQLTKTGLNLIKHAFPDHHVYTKNDLNYDRSGEKKSLLMTEKDAVKCRVFSTEDCWAVPVTAELSDNLISNITALLSHVINHDAD